MNPADRKRFERMERILNSIVQVEDVQFIENLKRRAGDSVRSDLETTAGSITTSVRNAADDGSESVASEFDGKVKIFLSDGTLRYIGVYNS